VPVGVVEALRKRGYSDAKLVMYARNWVERVVQLAASASGSSRARSVVPRG